MNQQLTPIDMFSSDLHSSSDIHQILPKHISQKKFLVTAENAVKNNPDLLQANKQSLFKAITQAAEDGLYPDGREGLITVYNTKMKIKGKEVWVKMAQWNPMLKGIRKRAMELASMIVDAQVVHENDHFEQEQGDRPSIEHKPPKLGQDRGKAVGVYAIFKIGESILHREVMDASQIEDVRQCSKQKDGLLWKKFWTEGWRKSVIRRGIKSVPNVPELERVVARDDATFDFSAEPITALPDIPDIPDEAPAIVEQTEQEDDQLADQDGFIASLEESLATADSPDIIQEIIEGNSDLVMRCSPENRKAVAELYERATA